jgi:pimeloyl-ACP methyl ester carboxylesterase
MPARLAVSSTLRLPQGTIRYRDSGGDTPPIVFLHGLLVDGRLWDGVLPHLAGHRLIVPDWPLGSHRTALHRDADLTPPGLARLVADVLAELDVRDVTLVANDTGGAIAQLVVTRHAARIGRLVLTNCDAYENFLPPTFRPLQLAARVPGLPWAISNAMRSRHLRNLPMAFGRLTCTPIDDTLARDWLRPASTDRGVRRDLAKILRGISRRYTLEAASRLRSFDGPTLFAWGREDPFFRPEYAEQLAADSSDAHVEWIEDARAFVPLDQPVRLAELIRQFVDKQDG